MRCHHLLTTQVRLLESSIDHHFTKKNSPYVLCIIPYVLIINRLLNIFLKNKANPYPYETLNLLHFSGDFRSF